jgi:ribonuclease HII
LSVRKVRSRDPAVQLADALGKGAAVAGLDEAGRGPLAGPVVAAAVVLPAPVPRPLTGLNDSKLLTHRQREALYPLIVRHALAFGVATVEVDRIDTINILRASLEAMAIAFERCRALLGRPIAGAVVDGNMRAPLHDDVVQRTVVNGDGLSRPIMAASILAKVTRDRRMQEEHERWPDYGFAAHKGYGTPEHLRALFRLGPSPLHRRSFAPVRAALVREE